MNKKSVTIYDIAKESGVSTATVSRVIAGNYPVSEKTRKKVMEAIEKYDFQPNAVARSLSSNRTKVIGFITPDIRNPFFSQIFIEVEKFAHEKGYSVLLCNSVHNRELESKYMRMLLEQRAEGIILLGGLINDINPVKDRVEELKQVMTKTKLVMINGEIDGVSCFSVRTDEGKGIDMLIDHLVEKGHTKIGILGGLKSITTTKYKVEAYRRAIKRHSLEYHEEWEIHPGFDIEAGEKAMKELLEKSSTLPTAVIGINDMVAIGLLKESRKQQIADMTIVGFDNTHLAITTNPELTTVSHPYEDLGKTAIEMLLAEEQIDTKEIILKPKLVIRESTLS